jgi:hypothetical protein
MQAYGLLCSTVQLLRHNARVPLFCLQVWCLDSQIQHKVALLKEHVLAPGRPPAVIVAHSIGSYIMLQAIHKLEQEMQAAATHLQQQQLPKVRLNCMQVKHVFLAFPIFASPASRSSLLFLLPMCGGTLHLF